MMFQLFTRRGRKRKRGVIMATIMATFQYIQNRYHFILVTLLLFRFIRIWPWARGALEQAVLGDGSPRPPELPPQAGKLGGWIKAFLLSLGIWLLYFIGLSNISSLILPSAAGWVEFDVLAIQPDTAEIIDVGAPPEPGGHLTTPPEGNQPNLVVVTVLLLVTGVVMWAAISRIADSSLLLPSD